MKKERNKSVKTTTFPIPVVYTGIGDNRVNFGMTGLMLYSPRLSTCCVFCPDGQNMAYFVLVKDMYVTSQSYPTNI